MYKKLRRIYVNFFIIKRESMKEDQTQYHDHNLGDLVFFSKSLFDKNICRRIIIESKKPLSSLYSDINTVDYFSA